ncbi:hypothetical protein BLA18628_03320 [Burkholderia aenigmatica]|nr:hypothetical protein BLA18628_03320 [Burkholderia aenigmatica]
MFEFRVIQDGSTRSLYREIGGGYWKFVRVLSQDA